MSAKNGNITRKQAAAVKALLEHGSLEDAANAAGVSTKTIYRWRQDPLFVAALDKAQGDEIRNAVRVLVVDLRANHEVMREIRDKPTATPGIRLRAAQALDTSLLRWKEIIDIDTRLTALELNVYGKQK